VPRPNFEIMDVTLRDGEQTPNVSYTPSEKFQLARLLLAELRVNRIEVGQAHASPGEATAVRRITSWARKEKLARCVEILGLVDGTRSVDWITQNGGAVLNLLTKGSRRHCETLITDGRVEVDGKVVTELGTQADPTRCEIRCDGELLRWTPRVYYLLNKPRGVICSHRTEPDKLRAVDLAPPETAGERLFTIGRLDVDSEGALILTNDGELGQRMLHPSLANEREYQVTVKGAMTVKTLRRLERGVRLDDGVTSPA